ncbi:GntR family transcriptional regulator [Salinimicrobium marinum]|uniref:GntR family transcriptional regulator n=1 Tax=Salinimicrobium marinum TaxID=680283 RepID=A0A918SLW0_9FLAO|nr:PLP-dependent aminotransferase family protein [Salinimicrobium marinum]GHA48537.1 GntR family transcriptional regulator [Salinimicrobium marinum]
MGSPVSISFRTFVRIDRRKEDPVYIQIVYQFINAVKTKLLEDGDRLPGSRKIAEELQVHRKTVVAALAELQEQGWVRSLPNTGTFVKNPELSSAKSPHTGVFQNPPERAAFSFRKEFILDSPFPEPQEKLSFTDGTPDYGMVKAQELLRSYGSVLKRAKQTGGLQHLTNENLFFRDQLSYYLNLSRGFHLSRNFLLPIAGREQVFSILSRLLIKTGDLILVEELSYFLPNMIFGQAGARLKTVPIDKDGMKIDHIREHFKAGEIRFVFINTRCQYPTTVRLSEKRKLQLLELAEQYNFIVVEDDADFEFSGAKDRSASLFRKDGGNRVIYTGAFGRFLTPGFQMNFLIGPKDLLEEARKYRDIFGKPNFMIEKALGEIIHQGDIHRYQRKAQKVISERKESFAQLLNSHFKDEISFSTPSSGLAFWIRFKEPLSLTRLQENSRKKGLLIPGICLYQDRRITALRLGFAHLNQQEMEEAIRILDETYREVKEIQQ